MSATLLQLQHDFRYNLLLLDGRDAELAQYDAETAALAAEVRARALAAEELRALAVHTRKGGPTSSKNRQALAAPLNERGRRPQQTNACHG